MKPNWNFQGRRFKHKKNLVGGAVGPLTLMMFMYFLYRN